MKTTASDLIRWAGLAAVVGGGLFAGIQPIHPSDTLASVTTGTWKAVHGAGVAMCLLILLGITGIYARQVREAGWLGLAGYLLFGAMWVLTAPFQFVEAFVLPPLASEAPGFVEGFVGIPSGSTGGADLGALPTVYTLNGVLYLLGGALFGIATFRAGILPRRAAGLLAVATVLPLLASPLVSHPYDSRTPTIASSRCRWGWHWPGWDWHSGPRGESMPRSPSLARKAPSPGQPEPSEFAGTRIERTSGHTAACPTLSGDYRRVIPSEELNVQANACHGDQAPSLPRLSEVGKPASRKATAPAEAGSAGWLLVAALLLLSAVPLAAGAFRLTQLAVGAEVTPANARFFAAPLPVVLHIVGAAVFAVLGAFQFATGLRRRRPGWHRAAGRLVVACGLLVGLSALWMTLFYPHPAGTSALLFAFRLLFGSAMVATMVLGFAAIRRRDVRRHRAWMMRGYAIGLGAGTQVLTLAAGEMIGGPPGELGRALLHGAAWVINLAVAEWAIRRWPAPWQLLKRLPGLSPWSRIRNRQPRPGGVREA